MWKENFCLYSYFWKKIFLFQVSSFHLWRRGFSHIWYWKFLVTNTIVERKFLFVFILLKKKLSSFHLWRRGFSHIWYWKFFVININVEIHTFEKKIFLFQLSSFHLWRRGFSHIWYWKFFVTNTIVERKYFCSKFPLSICGEGGSVIYDIENFLSPILIFVCIHTFEKKYLSSILSFTFSNHNSNSYKISERDSRL